MFKNEKNKCILITAVIMGLCFLGGYLIGRHNQDVHVIIYRDVGYEVIPNLLVGMTEDANGVSLPERIVEKMMKNIHEKYDVNGDLRK